MTDRRFEIFPVIAFYTVLAVLLTWPLIRVLTSGVPGDVGDPLLNTWILAWDATHLGRGWWNANIFHPHPLALGYSEHLLPQAVQILPIYAITRNAILCYNIVFLSTFVLSGVGTFLFARALTGSRRAAIVAGLAYACAPYRFGTIPHIQVLSSAWMPFVLLALHRYFTTERLRFLVYAGAAWLTQNLSCGYYLMFFSPIVAAYIAWELSVRRLWTRRRTILHVAALCAAVIGATIPFLVPYLELRQLGFSPRAIDETRRFSADTYAYLTADPGLRLIGPLMQAWPKAEGALFPGFTIGVLATLAVAAAWRISRQGGVNSHTRTSTIARALVLLVATAIALLVALLFGRPLRLPVLRATSAERIVMMIAALMFALMIVSAQARTTLRRWASMPVALFAAVTIFAIVMSFGPDIHARGRLVAAPGPYAFFYDYVPGFDGLRVPARFGMIGAFALAVLAGYGALAIDARSSYAAVVVCALIVGEAIATPITITDNSAAYKHAGLARLPDTLAPDAATRALYRAVTELPPSATLIELPLGEPAFDVRYMFYSTMHWRRLVNGYSGGQPMEYAFLDQALANMWSRPDYAWAQIIESQATHAIVHEAFYDGDRGARVSEFLRSHGARELRAFERHRMFQLRW